jgi:hypothetical protein
LERDVNVLGECHTSCTKRQLSAAHNKQLGWVVGGLFEGKPVSYHVQYILFTLSKNEDIKFNAHGIFLD